MLTQFCQANFKICAVKSKFEKKDSPVFAQEINCEASTRLM